MEMTRAEITLEGIILEETTQVEITLEGIIQEETIQAGITLEEIPGGDRQEDVPAVVQEVPAVPPEADLELRETA